LNANRCLIGGFTQPQTAWSQGQIRHFLASLFIAVHRWLKSFLQEIAPNGVG
jgi:hypothetical protein